MHNHLRICGFPVCQANKTWRPSPHFFAYAGSHGLKYTSTKQHIAPSAATTPYNLLRCHRSGGVVVCCSLKGNRGLTDRRYKQRKSSIVAKIAAVGCASIVLAGCIGFGIASAGGSAQEVDAFGIDAMSAPVSEADTATFAESATDSSAHEATVLASTAKRDISKGIEAIEAEEEAARIAAEEAARVAAAEAAKAEQQARAAQDSAASALASLPDVDFSVGKEAFISTWSQRIDAYLSGSPLAGQGVTFATAAWEYGVDPRWSPAISNTESSKGAVCFKPYNAWGWGQSSWGSWEEAINAHVAGLASAYGYSITYGAAMKYCPPNYDHWFNATLGQMQMI